MDLITANNKNTYTMKRTIKSYQMPKADVILISTEGVLCASDSKNGFDMGPMDKVDENENPWGWEE